MDFSEDRRDGGEEIVAEEGCEKTKTNKRVKQA